jgi:hypothetical protein
MEEIDSIDLISKIIDGLYKKLIVLLAISGGFGAYAIKFLYESNFVGYLFAIVFILVSIAIFITYSKLNIFVKKLERMIYE